MKKFLLASTLILFPQLAYAEPWTVGQVTASYATGTTPNVLGDNSNTRGGEAPAYAYEAADVASNFTVTNWELLAGASQGQYDTAAQGADEAKSRFDCNDAFEAHDDPILAPGVQGGSSHDHTFFGNLGAQAAPYNATYASLRGSGNSTCYGGPINRTLYWEPSLKTTVNGVVVTIRPMNIITYYVVGGISTDPPKVSRWPRDISFINGFNMSDPTDTYGYAALNAANAITPGRYSYIGNGFLGWKCGVAAAGNPNGVTAWSPNPSGQYQPYLYTSDGHPTLACDDTLVGSSADAGIEMDLQSQSCWDGVNLHSPDGRKHMMNAIRDNYTGLQVCPNGWYQTIAFSAKVVFPVKSNELANVWLSSDRMPGMTQFRNGETGHFDLKPAWDYGTGDAPGAMLKFFRSNGVTMRVKNSDNTTFTTLTGDSPAHEMGFGRIDGSTSLKVGASPDASLPNPIVNLIPDRSGKNRYYPIKVGTSAPGSVIHH